MTKLFVDLKSLDNIASYDADGLIVSSDRFSVYNDRCFSVPEIKRAVSFAKAEGKLIILSVDRIIEEEELADLYSYLDEMLELDIDYYIYGDFAVLAYFRKKKKTNRLIYDPKTLITSTAEAEFYRQMDSFCAISNELTFEEIKEIAAVQNGFVEVYGYHQMFYSRRPVLSSFSEYKKLLVPLDEKLLSLKEEIRSDRYPIFQSDHGTFIYTPYRYCFVRQLEELFPDLPMIRINSMFIEEEEIFSILSVYREILKGKIDGETAYLKLEAISSNLSEGFLKNKTVVLKEEHYD